jgi:GntR family transcriptional regulator, transcriptional repressor for pyruvate dehydrogenase complex
MNLSKKPKLKHSPLLSDQVAKFLISELESGKIMPGEIFPSEAKLADRFEVSRTVIREALSRLKCDGLLESKQGRRSIVKDTNSQRVFRLDRLEVSNLAEIGYLYEFRAILESEAGALAAKRRTQDDLERMSQNIDILNQAVRDGIDATAANVDFHMNIVEASKNPFLEDFMKFFIGKIWDLVQADRDQSSKKGLPPEVQQEHISIFKAISARDSDKARSAILTHLKNAAKRRNSTIFST